MSYGFRGVIPQLPKIRELQAYPVRFSSRANGPSVSFSHGLPIRSGLILGAQKGTRASRQALLAFFAGTRGCMA